MRFWWVNHKQTYSAEVGGGYIWSPKTNRNGSKNQTYINLTLTQPGDIVISYASGLIKAIGVATSPCSEKSKPSEFGSAGDSWSDTGWEVPIDWELLEQPIRPKDHLELIAPLLPSKNSPLQASGNGNQGCYLASISEELGNLVLSFTKEMNPSFADDIEQHQAKLECDAIETEIQDSTLDATEKQQLVKSRRGQGLFRTNLENVEPACRVTGVTNKALLIASHIKPWSVSDNTERLDGNNGLLLSPHIDKLFDRGWITFGDSGDLRCADREIEQVLKQWGISIPLNVGTFNGKQCEYLAYHRNEIYRSDPVAQE
ncbi:HNH endonuclease [Aeromonas veronii]|uniref:HNH endonuclease n=1 Tax=Aeromonas veronii TaxID=654 RepID=UPI001F32B09C|nr:HNH endonuclease signature motif containing protein [Aeromonas veronii]MCF5894752.1 HNH endonuclease [Aeromonas veronii]